MSNPAMWAEAGLVPWAESGTSSTRRACSPRLWNQARNSFSPANSPCAPAKGCSVPAFIPVMAHRLSIVRWRISRIPWTVEAGCRGWMSRNQEAISSLILGLYFMVHDPRG